MFVLHGHLLWLHFFSCRCSAGNEGMVIEFLPSFRLSTRKFFLPGAPWCIFRWRLRFMNPKMGFPSAKWTHMEWPKTCGPYSGGLILTHTQIRGPWPQEPRFWGDHLAASVGGASLRVCVCVCARLLWCILPRDVRTDVLFNQLMGFSLNH